MVSSEPGYPRDPGLRAAWCQPDNHALMAPTTAAQRRQRMRDDLKNLATSEGYRRWLYELKQRVEHARQRAAASVHRELIRLYWQIGSEILQRQQNQVG